MAGGGKSTQQANPVYTDNRAVLGEGSLYANNGANISTFTTNYTLDGGAIDKAYAFAGDAAAIAGDVINRGVAGVLSFAGDSQASVLDTVSRNVVSTLDFAADSQAGALTTVQGAMTAVRGALDGALDFGSQALAANQVNVGRVLDATADTQSLVADAYNDAKGRGAMTDKLLMAAVAAMAIVAFAAVKK